MRSCYNRKRIWKVSFAWHGRVNVHISYTWVITVDPYFLLLYGLTPNGLDAWSIFRSLGVISAPTAAVALVKTFNRTKARIGLKSRPKIGGIRPLKRFRYGSVIWNTGCKTPIPVMLYFEKMLHTLDTVLNHKILLKIYPRTILNLPWAWGNHDKRTRAVITML